MRRDLETPHVSIFGVISCRAWSLQMLRPSYNLYFIPLYALGLDLTSYAVMNRYGHCEKERTATGAIASSRQSG